MDEHPEQQQRTRRHPPFPPMPPRRARHVPRLPASNTSRNVISRVLGSYRRARSEPHPGKCVHGGEVVRRRPLSRYKSRMATERPKAIDCWLNLPVGFTDYRPEFLVRVARDYFKREKEIFEPAPLAELLRPDGRGGRRARHHHHRRATTRSPSTRSSALSRQVPALGDDRPPAGHGDDAPDRPSRHASTTLRPGAHHAVPGEPAAERQGVLPVYAKCIELGLPISINTGIPGPPMPAEPQRPLYLDEVCLFFPELTLIMAHGADPWWGEAIRLLLKYPNLYMMTSAYAPKYLPAELIQFMNTRGAAEDPLRVRSPGASVRALPRRGRGAAASRRRPREVPARERAARLPVARSAPG